VKAGVSYQSKDQLFSSQRVVLLKDKVFGNVAHVWITLEAVLSLEEFPCNIFH